MLCLWLWTLTTAPKWDLFFLFARKPRRFGTKIIYTTAENKSKEEIGLDSQYFEVAIQSGHINYRGCGP